MKKKVVRIEDGVVFDSLEDVVIKTGTNISSLSSALHGRYHTANGYHWKFYNEEEVKCAND